LRRTNHQSSRARNKEGGKITAMRKKNEPSLKENRGKKAPDKEARAFSLTMPTTGKNGFRHYLLPQAGATSRKFSTGVRPNQVARNAQQWATLRLRITKEAAKPARERCVS